MSRFLLDTHAWAFLHLDRSRIPTGMMQELETADAIFISPISAFEIAQKVRVGKWPEAAHLVGRFPDLIGRDGTQEAPVTAAIALLAGQMDWPHRDPFDRFLAATAELDDLTLVTMDRVFATRPGLRTAWES
ncbi:PIN domain nuclease, a component of toxin-antitoxin system (PIN domain) [Roseivivax lentus]|uniref:PIN domain nuclease, a component of toxin-antitoxin system (PIN domain) n=1 Tax=Roseivivax lentus TaxID=633194 RepID=A0A1N7P743_9RHOB|nr:type II toxin-antitoxin system VapC family toxin [Roseivivax lentus]SIT06403.1 PIN domain nuclease, a component of toxin-antitoxin system (PIN domain) [Roseivivax lentus]